MKIVVDADACPVKREIITLARERGLGVVLVCNFHHQMQEEESVTVVTVDDSPDEADFALVNLLEPGDIVVTQDYGAAAMALGKQSPLVTGSFDESTRPLPIRALSPRGLIFTHENILNLLEQRHRAQVAMRRGRYPKAHSKFQAADRQKFVQALTRLLEAQ